MAGLPTGVLALTRGVRRQPAPNVTRVPNHTAPSSDLIAFAGYLPDLDVTVALAVDAMRDPTPLLLAAVTALAPQDP